MTRILSIVKDLIVFHNSYYIRAVVALGLILYFTLFSLVVMDNPFSSYSSEDVIEYCSSVSISDIVMEKKYNGEEMSDRNYKDISKDMLVVIIKEPAPADETVKVRSISDRYFEYDASIENLSDCNIRSFPPLTSLDIDNSNEFFPLGITTNGYDLLSKLLDGISLTFYYSVFSLVTFLSFGVVFGILIGYYRGHFPELSSTVNAILKSFESIPIIFLVLITFISLNMMLHPENELLAFPITYSLFGFFAAPTLAKLIIGKFNYLQNNDFIVALKLLGISDRRIIFNHIVKYYCSTVIIFQAIYIFAHALYLDITMTFIELFIKQPTLGGVYYETYQGGSFSGFVIFSVIIFFLLSTLFYTTRYLKVKAEV